TFSRLFDRGDWAGCGYGSPSEADLALASLLAFWTGGDAARVDRLFRASALSRPKWDEARGATTYGGKTIGTAISTTALGAGGSCAEGEAMANSTRTTTADAAADAGSPDAEQQSRGTDGGNGADPKPPDEWPELVPLDGPPVPAFPVDALPPV